MRELMIVMWKSASRELSEQLELCAGQTVRHCDACALSSWRSKQTVRWWQQGLGKQQTSLISLRWDQHGVVAHEYTSHHQIIMRGNRDNDLLPCCCQRRREVLCKMRSDKNKHCALLSLLSRHHAILSGPRTQIKSKTLKNISAQYLLLLLLSWS